MSYNLKAFLLALFSSVLLWISWPPHQLAWLSFIAFVPLLFIQDFHKDSRINTRVFLSLVYVSLLGWNVLTTWWIWIATPGGSIAAIVLNTLIMSAVWLVFDLVSKKMCNVISYAFLISFWVSYEFLHLNWEITWPWLVIGNVFANNTSLIQWYEFTGHLGGSIWVLLVNIFLFFCIRNFTSKTFLNKNFIISTLVISIPVIISHFTLLSRNQNLFDQEQKKVSVLLIQPNLDPYSEKFGDNGKALSSNQQLERMLQMAEENIDANIKFVVLPETALQGGILETEINNESLINSIQHFLRKYPNTCVIAGAESYILYQNKQTLSARAFGVNGKYLDYFNTAFKIDTSAKIEIYHKSRLVPGVEKLPYPAIFGGLVHFLKLDAEAGGLGTQAEASIFVHDKIKVAPLICYESVFGGYVQEFMKKDANVMFVITNDGWWGNTDGYKQHLDYGKLRCIEFRKELLQCANTGISAHINNYGEILKQTEWWKQQVLEVKFTPNSITTFYARHGDYLGWIGLAISFAILMLSIAKFFARRFR